MDVTGCFGLLPSRPGLRPMWMPLDGISTALGGSEVDALAVRTPLHSAVTLPCTSTHTAARNPSFSDRPGTELVPCQFVQAPSGPEGALTRRCYCPYAPFPGAGYAAPPYGSYAAGAAPGLAPPYGLWARGTAGDVLGW